MAQQLGLEIKPLIKYSFDNYVVSDDNTQAISHLRFLSKVLDGSYIYLWGSTGVGKSHLLQAITEQAINNNITATYISFQNLAPDNSLINTPSNLAIDILDSLEMFDIICLDDLNYIAGNKEWEEALFGLYNRIKDANKNLIISSDCSVNNLNVSLPDLKSRLSSGVSYCINNLCDDDKKALLTIRAHERGISLSEQIAQFLISRGRRDISGLFEMLDELDLASIRHKRKLTIPFVKEILNL